MGAAKRAPKKVPALRMLTISALSAGDMPGMSNFSVAGFQFLWPVLNCFSHQGMTIMPLIVLWLRIR